MNAIENCQKVSIIDDQLKSLFQNVTGCNFAPGYSAFVCELCARTIHMTNSFKNQLLTTQTKLIQFSLAHKLNGAIRTIEPKRLPAASCSMRSVGVIMKKEISSEIKAQKIPIKKKSIITNGNAGIKIEKVQSGEAASKLMLMNNHNPSNQTQMKQLNTNIKHEKVPYTLTSVELRKSTRLRQPIIKRERTLYMCGIAGCKKNSYASRVWLKKHIKKNHSELTYDETAAICSKTWSK